MVAAYEGMAYIRNIYRRRIAAGLFTREIREMKPKPLPKAKIKMTAKAYRDAIAEIGLSQTRAGQFFGFSDRQGQRMARGEADLLPAVIHLLNLMIKHGVRPADLDQRFVGLE
jgi:hypothetical protein